jgi:RNA polymerase-binding transcription factor
MTAKTTPAQTTTVTVADADAIRAQLESLRVELTTECEQTAATAAAAGQLGDGAGDDEVDSGARTSQREQQMSVVATIRDRQDQVEHAMRRLDGGTYGRCEVCGQPIAPERLAAFPSATTCIGCKRAGERRG